MSAHLEKEVAYASSIRGILHSQLFVHPKPLPPSLSLKGQTALITGANAGLGFEASRQLLQLGLSRLILAVRSQRSGDEAARKLNQEFPNRQFDVWLVDLTDPASIVALAERCQTLNRLDYAILNAGVQLGTFKRCEKTGHEMTLQVNYLSNFLLAIHLAIIMKAKKPSRGSSKPPVLSVVGSDTMYLSKLEKSASILSYFDDETRYSKFEHYRDSKLLVMMSMSRLAEKFSPDDVVINVSNPGMTGGTGFGKDEKPPPIPIRWMLQGFVKLIGRTPFSGASVYVNAILAQGKESHGSFVSDWAIKPYARQLYTPAGKAMLDNLWTETMEDLKSFLPINTGVTL